MTVCFWSSQQAQILLNWMTACIVSPQSLLSECITIYRWTMNPPYLPDNNCKESGLNNFISVTITVSSPLFHKISMCYFIRFA